MPYTRISAIGRFSNVGTRNEVRERVITAFLQESPGTGRGKNASRYDYEVAHLQNGSKVILTRPANLKNGFDFLIRVSNTNFNPNGRARDYPRHDDIIGDLILKKRENLNVYQRLKNEIVNIYHCNSEVEDVDLSIYKFATGYDIDLILHTIKWFFIEQDIRYWNYSGRSMLMGAIP